MSESPLFWLNFFALIYLIVTSIILLRNRIELTGLPQSAPAKTGPLKISVCIPARNEDTVIGKLLHSVCSQQHKNFEVLVLNDDSEDNTAGIIQRFRKQYPKLVTPIAGLTRPDGWLGKPWACKQLGKSATGDIILFLDADTELYPGFLDKLEASFHKHHADMVTVWPEQILNGFWQRTVLPLVYYSLFTLLPATYVYRNPRWMPAYLHNKFVELYTAACGQCIAITKDAYNAIGGHETVKSKVVEDVELARVLRRTGFQLRMFSGVDSICCEMYRTASEMFNGFRKNFLAGFKNSVPKFTAAALIHIVVFIIPFFSVFYALIYMETGLFLMAAASVTLILSHRLILSMWFKWDPVYSFLHPVGVLWFQYLGIVKLVDHFSGKKVLWKGRKVS